MEKKIIKREKQIIRKNFIPQTISESILIATENETKLSLIETKESPSLESDLRYILETSKINIFDKIINGIKRFLKFNREVKTDYFLTYHQKKDDEIKVKRRGKNKNNFQFIGDEILQIIKFSSGALNIPFLIYITDFEVGGTRYSKEFLQHEGFIPLERFIGKNKPKWIIIGAGPTAAIQEVYIKGNDEKYLIIPGKINFRFWDRFGLSEYKFKLFSSTEFLHSHSNIRKMARENNVETTILISEKMLVLERIDTNWGDIWKIFFKSMKKHKDISLTLTGGFFFNLGIGFQQGAIINPILNMMDKFGILVMLVWLMQYIYPNIVYTISVILSADRFDKIKSAEKAENMERATINIELKKVLLNAGILSIISVFLLILIYPGFLVRFFLTFFLIKFIIGIIYVASTFFRDWPVTFEQDAFFRILKRSLIKDEELYKSILKINAFSYSGSIIFNLLGIVIGWFAMKLSPVFGIAITIIGAFISFTKLLYPYYGKDYGISINININPFYSNENEVVIIPSKVLIKSKSAVKIHTYKKNRIIYDNYDFEIVIMNNKFIPKIKEKKHIYISSIFKTWDFSWKSYKEKAKIKIILKDKKNDFILDKIQLDNAIVYKPILL